MSVAPGDDPRALIGTPFELLAALDRRYRAARLHATASSVQTWQGLAFRLDHRWMLAPRDDVREVIPRPATTRVPHAKSWLSGIANVRGSLCTLVDLGLLFGATPTVGRAARVLVLNSDRVPAGFLVDEVAGYRHFTVGDQAPPRIAAHDPLAPFVLGGFAGDGEGWVVLSLRRLAQSDVLCRAGA